MPLDKAQRGELERRGPRVIQLLLEGPGTGHSRGAEVPLQAGCANPSRADVEDWLSENDRAAQRSVSLNLVLAFVAALASVVAAIFAALGYFAS